MKNNMYNILAFCEISESFDRFEISELFDISEMSEMLKIQIYQNLKFHNLKVQNNPITDSGLEVMSKTPSRLSQASPVGTALDQALDQIASLKISGPSVS